MAFIKHILLLLGLLTGPIICSFAQSRQLQSLNQAFDQYCITTLQEKLYTHTDRNTYLAGEILWFKVYCTDATTHKPIDLSKVAYVELLSKDSLPVWQSSIALQDGTGQGSFFIPASLEAGNYMFRAYTNWMKNTGPDYFFQKQISIVNTFMKPEQALPDSSRLDIDFFPEGGHLVAGLESKVAFKVADAQGKGVYCNGYIVDQKKDTVSSFTPLKFGIGHFMFTPRPGYTYKAYIKDQKGRLHTRDLPYIHRQGMVMQLLDEGHELLIRVQCNADVQGQNAMLYLLAHTRQARKASLAAPLQQGTALFKVDKSILGEGISHLTLFNSTLQPVSERLYFKKPKHLLNIKTEAEGSYAPRTRVHSIISTLNTAGQPVAANLSVAVYKLDSLSSIDENTIVNSLWFTSDLRGNIESPDYYLTSLEPIADLAADNLMLTHGWRRFKWTDVLNGQKTAPSFMPEYNGQFVQARVLHKLSGQPAEGIASYLATPNKRIRLYTGISNAAGLLQFELNHVYGPQNLVLQLASPGDSLYQLEYISPFSVHHSAYSLPALYLPATLKKELRSKSIHLQVLNAHYEDHLNRFQAPVVDSLPFFGNSSYTYQLDDYNRFRVMEEVLREYVFPVAVRKRRGKYVLKILDQSNKLLIDDPLILLDGLPVADADHILAYNPLKVKTIQVVPQQYYLGSAVFPGIISFSTYQGDLSEFKLSPTDLLVEYEGLQLQREFHVPQYATTKQRSSPLPDLRNLLLWAPQVVTGTDGKQALEFYTSDQQGRYLFVVEGLTKEGLAGSSTFVFEVKGAVSKK